MAILWILLTVFGAILSFSIAAMFTLPLLVLAIPVILGLGLLLLLWVITENLLISAFVIGIIFALIWIFGGDTEEIKAEIKRREAEKQATKCH